MTAERLERDWLAAAGRPVRAINDQPLRTAMGLPESFSSGDGSALQAAVRDQLTLDGQALATIVGSTDACFAQRHAAGLLLSLAGDVRLGDAAPNMVRVPAGTYRIGTDHRAIDGIVAEFAALGVRRDWIEKEAPAHEVTLDAFALGRFPVTNVEYARFLADTGHRPLPTSWRFGILNPAEANQPVYGMTARCADAYARWLSNRTGRAFRLPTEAEWEVAAGGGVRVYPWGDDYAADRANTLESGILSPTPVGLFPKGASFFGCLDMAGNVEEFVRDGYHAYPGGRFIADDLAAADPAYRVARGGSFTRYRDLARCARRHGHFPSPLYAIGFRLAETLIGQVGGAA